MHYVTSKYEGRSINKLQNNIILLIFKISKSENINFVGNIIGDIHWNFYDDDVITVTSLELKTQSVSAVFSPAVFFYNFFLYPVLVFKVLQLSLKPG